MIRSMRLSSVPRLVRVVLLVQAVWLVGLEASAVMPSHPWSHTVFGNWASEGVQLVAAALCLAAAWHLQGRARLAWALIAAGIVVWTLGDIYWVTLLAAAASPPIPSPADIGYLLFVPFVLVGLLVLLHTRVSNVPRTVLVDGVIVALAAATVAAAFVLQPVISHTTGDIASVATNLAYPLTDLVLLGVILAAITLRGWRIDMTWGLLGAGVIAFWIADSLYLVTIANGSYTQPSLFDAGWVGSTILFAAAAWAPPQRQQDRVTGTREILLPLSLAFTAIMVTLFQGAGQGHVVTLALGAACTGAVMVRLIITFRENVSMLQTSRREALTDALTGLANRRALTADLERGLETAHVGDPLVLALFDLNGFKHYNDTFGHPAGDALLARLGHNLERCVERRGCAYRVGGDEFCILISPGAEIAKPIVDAAVHALTDRGDGFAVDCAYGVVVLPLEAPNQSEALRVADHRMYAAKNSGRTSAGSQSKDVLLRAICERDAELGVHVVDVASMADAVARQLGMDPAEVEQVRTAAELHDIGKVAIPDAILHKPGPLDAREWQFIHEHTLIGERIIAAAPSLGHVAAIVRSTHERFDGTGYPDALTGTDILLGARIVAVCDAFDAIVTTRSYRPATSPAAALAELRRCAGSQFDPVVVQVFCEEWAKRQTAAIVHA